MNSVPCKIGNVSIKRAVSNGHCLHTWSTNTICLKGLNTNMATFNNSSFTRQFQLYNKEIYN